MIALTGRKYHRLPVNRAIVLTFLILDRLGRIGRLGHSNVLLSVEGLLSSWWHVDLLRLLLKAIDAKLVLLIKLCCVLVVELVVLRVVHMSGGAALVLLILLNKELFVQCVRSLFVLAVFAEVLETVAAHQA